MLSSKEKYVLKKIINKSKSGNPYFDEPTELFNAVCKKINYIVLGLILDSLLEKGFIDSENYIKLIDGGRQFTVTQKTMDYKENKKMEIIRFAVTSVIIPIIVSIITTLITSFGK